MNENIQKKCVLQSLALGGNESNLAPQAAMSKSAAVPPVLVSILYNKNRTFLLQNWGWNNIQIFPRKLAMGSLGSWMFESAP